MKLEKKQAFRHAAVVTENGIIQDGAVIIIDDKISFVGKDAEAEAAGQFDGAACVDFGGDYLMPGFVDIHVHGGGGHDFMDADQAAYNEITNMHSKHGTTAMLATTVTAPKADIDHVLQAVSTFQQSESNGARLIGVHLEGPFLSNKFPGAQNPEYMVPAQLQWLEEWTKAYPGLIQMMTLAPETEGGLDCVSWLSEHHIVAACGHTASSYDEIQNAQVHGLRHAVHTFNAMTGLHHRNPGTAGAVMTNDAISCEIIADGHHVHPAAIQLLYRAKKQDKLILITDAMSAAGMPDGSYKLGVLDVTVSGGVARLKEGDSLAGSTLTMIQGFRFLVEKVGISVEEASRMASGAPARVIGFDHEIGSIAAGKKADLLRIDADLALQAVWNEGRLVTGTTSN